MTIEITRRVGDLAAEIPGATRVFQKMGIDYCCGGERSLEKACLDAGVAVQTVLQELRAAQEAEPSVNHVDWTTQSLSALVAHILRKHHVFTRGQLELIAPLSEKVRSVHGEGHPELARIHQLFQALEQELRLHMQKEEMVLFPYVEQMEKQQEGTAAAPGSCFGTVRNPVRVMIMEHDNAGDVLKQIRTLSSDYTVPPDACMSFRKLYDELQALEQDLFQHIHLENNILFPRAIEMEEKVSH
ncbi:MAG: iron-sulfur cluster repair di-iron protein [Acidobacteria bacterium]|nr:iron-sulfur cluster repair di-iron protein [Acidobacteriota bacterium]